jgi:hypothetical protein
MPKAVLRQEKECSREKDASVVIRMSAKKVSLPQNSNDKTNFNCFDQTCKKTNNE